jgi:hypothetical protein
VLTEQSTCLLPETTLTGNSVVVEQPTVPKKDKNKEDEILEPYHKVNRPETYFVLSSVVTVCFNLPIGILALLCSWRALQSFQNGDMKTGRKQAKWAFCLSMFAMVLTVCLVMTLVFYVAYMSASKN